MPTYPEPRLVDDLQGAAARGELVAHFQPQLDLPSGRIVAVEALARWNHPTLGPIPPIAFISVAETHGLINEVGDHILAASIQQVAAWRDAGLSLDLAVNMSPNQLSFGDVCQTIGVELERWGLESSALTVEITETEPIADLRRVVECLGEIRGLGCGVSIDDFGAGYTSLEQLRDLPATELKLDQSTLRGDPDHAFDRLSPVMREARRHGLRVVAEGVETNEQLALATRLGCDRAQGYLIGAPMAAETLERTIR